MSNSNQNLNVRKLRGKIGDQIVYKMRFGKSYAANIPAPSSKGPNEAQSKIRLKFKMATLWAKKTLSDPAQLAMYQALSKGAKTPWILAMTNYLKPPTVAEIDLGEYQGNVGDKIVVIAVDDINVKSVSLTIKKATGEVIEKGECQPDDIGLLWNYTATTEIANLNGVIITGTAKDDANHNGSLSVTL